MDPHQDWIFRIDLALDHGDVKNVVHIVFIDHDLELAGECGGDDAFRRSPDKGFLPHPVLDEVGDGADADPLPFAELWEDRQTIRLGGVDIDALSLDHTLLLPLAHGSAHAWGRLFWLADIARLATHHPDMDWNAMVKKAARLGIARMAAEGIFLAHLLFDLPLPKPIQVFAQNDSALDRLVLMAIFVIGSSDYPTFRPFSRGYRYLKHHRFLLRSDLKYKLAFGREHITPPVLDWEKTPLPDRLFPLYFFLRPFAWFARFYLRKAK